jgi:methyl coenzyme M reductase alpha subunit
MLCKLEDGEELAKTMAKGSSETGLKLWILICISQNARLIHLAFIEVQDYCVLKNTVSYRTMFLEVKGLSFPP